MQLLPSLLASFLPVKWSLLQAALCFSKGRARSALSRGNINPGAVMSVLQPGPPSPVDLTSPREASALVLSQLPSRLGHRAPAQPCWGQKTFFLTQLCFWLN